MKNGVVIFWVAILAVIVLGFGSTFFLKSGPGQLDTFAMCLKDKGVIFYGAFWCPHCQNTKKMFGKSAKLLPYVECSTPDGKGQLQICKDKNIQNYPTWVGPMSTSTLTGERTLQELSDFSGCPLPQ
ncbi:MAG: thioredoxin domain-containing protein [bacterium]|nr:thioredoxin domain-containing protein [bacterium]